jgi:cyanophycin synthetase
MGQELLKRGFTVTEIDPSFYFATNGIISFYGESSKTPAQSTLVQTICVHKDTTKLFLQHHNFPTAYFVIITPSRWEEVQKLHFPVVAKPLALSSGEGVRTGIKSIEELREYFVEHNYQKILVEETLQGEDTRLLVIRGQFFAAVKRLPAYVIGNGQDSIAELIMKESKRREALLDRQKETGIMESNIYPILDDYEIDLTLQNQGLNRFSVPQENERVFVRRNANVSTGGVSIDVTNEVGPALRQMCADIALAMGANTLGIDVMTYDLSLPLDTQAGTGIVEINHSPGLALHAFPYEGKPRDPSALLVDEILEFLQHNPQAASRF